MTERDPAVAPPPEQLYTPADLFEGWELGRPESAAETWDFRQYRIARAEGLRMPRNRSTAAARAEHDTAVSWLLQERLRDERVMAIMGGHGMARNHPGYRLVAELSAALGAAGCTVLTGGGPGAMEAGHLGAATVGSPLTVDQALAVIGADAPEPTTEAERDLLRFPVASADEFFTDGDAIDPTQVARLHAWQRPAFALLDRLGDRMGESIGIPTWMYGHEPPTPLASRQAKYFDNSIREDGLLALAVDGVVFAPGRAGTLQEIFADAAQNAYRTVAGRFSPMVFLDLDEYWSVDFGIRQVLERLFDDAEESMVHWVDTVPEVLAALGVA